MTTAPEIEAKFLNIDPDDLRFVLKSAGFYLFTPERLMRRQIFNFKDVDSTRKWARVRDEGHRVSMTVKEVVKPGAIDGTLETEIVLKDNDMFEDACAFAKHLGLTPAAYQESRREDWEYSLITVSLDWWPGLPPQVEIESLDKEGVQTAARHLGLDYSQARFGNIMHVYREVLGIPNEAFQRIERLTFDNPPTRWTG